MQFYTYKHERADTGEVFYIGKGKLKKLDCEPLFERAYEQASRNPHWKRIVAKHGLTVVILARFETDAQAQSHERLLIAAHGRYDLGRGPLVNLTDGGDGWAGLLVTPETRRKRSEHAKKKRSDAWVKSIRAARKNGGNGGVVKKGDKLPDEWRASIAAAQRGPNNYMRGRTGAAHPNRREVVNTETGERYPTVQAAAEATGMAMKTLYNRLSGHRANPTPMRFA